MPTLQETALAVMNDQQPLTCSACMNEFTADDEIFFDDQSLCPDCADQLTAICTFCGERIWLESNAGDAGTPLCRHCYENHYVTCEDCGAIINFYDSYHDDDDSGDYCLSCYNDRHSQRKIIHEYHFKPDPIFYPPYSNQQLYYGVELEIDGGGEDSDNARELLQIANQSSEYLYIKHDGSLNDGLELVSHPCSLEHHLHHVPWQDICRKAITLGYTSHNAGTAGLHIHISRTAFGVTYQKQEEVVARILYFVESHFNEMLRFSRRTEAQLNRWAARYGIKETPKAVLEHAKNSCLGRYTAINLQNGDTLEFRFYRGSLRHQTFIAALQITHEICNAAIVMSDDGFRAMSWSDFVLRIDKDQAPELIDYLKQRRLYVNEEIPAEEEI